MPVFSDELFQAIALIQQMQQSQSRFFIALLPPQHIQNYANDIKRRFADNYASRSAQKSPPHITLQPPFEWADTDVSILEDYLNKFTHVQKPVPVTLDGFAAFAPRVIYINVVQTPELMSLQVNLMRYVEKSLGIVDKNYQNRSFTPHITVAFRDLTKQNFKAAWSEFEKQKLHFEFISNELTLLLHDGKRWNVKTKFSFAGA